MDGSNGSDVSINNNDMRRGIYEVDRANGDGLGDRMKAYERATGTMLNPDFPAVVRVSGRGFKRYCGSNFDSSIFRSMVSAASSFCCEVPGALLGYLVRDELTVLIGPGQMWYGGRTQKIVSNAATMFSELFNRNRMVTGRLARFEARTLNLPHDEQDNYLLWRQRSTRRDVVPDDCPYAQHRRMGTLLENNCGLWQAVPTETNKFVKNKRYYARK